MAAVQMVLDNNDSSNLLKVKMQRSARDCERTADGYTISCCSFGMVSGVHQRNCLSDWHVHQRHLANTVERLCTAAVSGFVTMVGNAA